MIINLLSFLLIVIEIIFYELHSHSENAISTEI